MNAHESINKTDDSERIYKIGELAEEFDVTLRTLRFYEDKELLSPRRAGSTRLYSRTDRARLQLILLAKRLGFSLKDIKQFLELYDPAESNLTQLKFALDKGQEQMNVLQAERRKLDASIAELDETIETVRAMIAKIEK
jgi:DNA-binding transcriptional MerR regulator